VGPDPFTRVQISYAADVSRSASVSVSVTTDVLPDSGLNKTTVKIVNQKLNVGSHDGLHSLGVFYLGEGAGSVRVEKTAVR